VSWQAGLFEPSFENRSRRTHHRGPLLIHAGFSLDDCTEEVIESLEAEYGGSIRSELYIGGIVGVVDVIDCVESKMVPKRKLWLGIGKSTLSEISSG
jgi:hypothetical protein